MPTASNGSSSGGTRRRRGGASVPVGPATGAPPGAGTGAAFLPAPAEADDGSVDGLARGSAASGCDSNNGGARLVPARGIAPGVFPRVRALRRDVLVDTNPVAPAPAAGGVPKVGTCPARS